MSPRRDTELLQGLGNTSRFKTIAVKIWPAGGVFLFPILSGNLTEKMFTFVLSFLSIIVTNNHHLQNVKTWHPSRDLFSLINISTESRMTPSFRRFFPWSFIAFEMWDDWWSSHLTFQLQARWKRWEKKLLKKSPNNYHPYWRQNINFISRRVSFKSGHSFIQISFFFSLGFFLDSRHDTHEKTS